MENRIINSEATLRESAKRNWGRFIQAASRSYVPPHFIDTSATASKEIASFLKTQGIVNKRLVVQATARRLFNHDFATCEESAYTITYARAIAAIKIWMSDDQLLATARDGVSMLKKLGGNVFVSEREEKMKQYSADVDRIKKMAEIACGLVLAAEGTSDVSKFISLRQWVEEYFSETSNQLKAMQ